MHTLTIRRAATVLFAALSLALSTAAVSHAQPIGPDQPAAGCKLPGNGTVVSSGSTGTDSDGKTYSCTNGVGCQVEGGVVTTKCSHMATLTTGTTIRVPRAILAIGISLR
jgi:hypothetical protein